MRYVKTVLIGMISAIVLSPLFGYAYFKYTERNLPHDGLVGYAGGPRYDWLLVPAAFFVVGAGIYWLLTRPTLSWVHPSKE